MNARSFLDSSVLVYTDDATAPRKQAAALDLVRRCRREGKGVVSTQVLQEYFVVATRRLGVADEIARRKVELFTRLDLSVVQLDDMLAAIDLRRVHGFSFWDALVLRTALRAGCRVLYSENLKTRRRIDGLKIVNPFA